eukprot:1200634-Pyramimonas_sp.AAC.1
MTKSSGRYIGLSEEKPAGARVSPHSHVHGSTTPSVTRPGLQRVPERLFQYVPVQRAPEASCSTPESVAPRLQARGRCPATVELRRARVQRLYALLTRAWGRPTRVHGVQSGLRGARAGPGMVLARRDACARISRLAIRVTGRAPLG